MRHSERSGRTLLPPSVFSGCPATQRGIPLRRRHTETHLPSLNDEPRSRSGGNGGSCHGHPRQAFPRDTTESEFSLKGFTVQSKQHKLRGHRSRSLSNSYPDDVALANSSSGGSRFEGVLRSSEGFSGVLRGSQGFEGVLRRLSDHSNAPEHFRLSYRRSSLRRGLRLDPHFLTAEAPLCDRSATYRCLQGRGLRLDSTSLASFETACLPLLPARHSNTIQ